MPEVRFSGNFAVFIFDDPEGWRRACRVAEEQCCYVVRRWDKYGPRFERVVRYHAYPEYLAVAVMRGLKIRMERLLGLRPTPYVPLDLKRASASLPSWLRDYQREVCEWVLAYLKYQGAASVMACAGSGKTEMAIAIWSVLRPRKTFVLSLNTDLCIQFKRRFEKYGFEAGLVNKDHFEIEEPVVCCTVQSLYKALKRVNEDRRADKDLWEGLEEVRSLHEVSLPSAKKKVRRLVEEYKRASLVIIDEVHHVPARTVMYCMLNNPWCLRLGLSATPWRSDGRDLDIYAVCGDVVPRQVFSSELIRKGYLVPARIYMLHYRPRYAAKASILGWMEVKRLVMTDRRRARLIAELASGLPKPCLILVREILQGRIICEELGRRGLRYSFVYGMVDPDLREKVFDMVRSGEIEVLVATTLADEGLDLPPLRSIILAGGGKSYTRTFQRVGRALRPYPGKERAVIVDIWDEVKYFADHARERLRMYKAEPDWEIRHVRI